MTEAAPHGIKAGRAVHALFTQRELASDGFGIAVLPWLDVTAEGLDDAMLPESEEVKEALLRMMRDSTRIAPATMANTIEARVRSLIAGNPGASRTQNPPHVFPCYKAAEPAAVPLRQGMSTFNWIWKADLPHQSVHYGHVVGMEI